MRNTPLEIDGQQLNVTISAGVARGFDEERLLLDADTAMYAAKEAGRDQVKTA